MYYKEYPLEKYKFYTDNSSVVVAVACCNGKKFKGIAKCSDLDEFNLELGKKIAAEKCNLLIKKYRLKKNEEHCYYLTNVIERFTKKLNKYEAFIKENLEDIDSSCFRLENLKSISIPKNVDQENNETYEVL